MTRNWKGWNQEYCVAAPPQVHTILIDSSDEVSASQKRQIKELIDNFLLASRGGHWVNVVLLTHDMLKPVEWLFTKCDPGSGAEKSILFNTPARVDHHRNETFIKPLNRVIEEAQVPAERPATPLIEGLHGMSYNSLFRGGLANEDTEIRCLIISDLLQNSSRSISAYNDTLYQPHNLSYAASFKPWLNGVEMHLGVIDRPKFRKKQSQRHWQWFDQHLRAGGVQLVNEPVRIV